MKTTYHGYSLTIPKPKREDIFEYDWLYYNFATDNVRDIRPFLTRKVIPTG